MRRNTSILVNALLVVCSIALAWALAEFVLFKPLLRHIPAPLFNHMVREARVLGQSSKDGLVPGANYLGMSGDSYSQGLGDWFIESGYNRYAGFHSAHLLNDALGVDVVSFGRSGAGSVEGLVLEPLQDIRYLRRMGFDIAPPHCLLYYFYEGNDLGDNLKFLVRHFYPAGHTPEQVFDDAAFAAFLDGMVEEYSMGRARSFADGLPFSKFALQLLRDKLIDPLGPFFGQSGEPKPSGAVNRLRVGGQEQYAPNRMQSPGVGMTSRQVDEGVAVFRHALAYARRALPKTRIFVVYIPAPLSCYDIVSDSVHVNVGPKRMHPAGEVERMHLRIRDAVHEAVRAQDVDWIDATPRVRQACEERLLHGPVDWQHFNKTGYETLTGAILEQLAAHCEECFQRPCPKAHGDLPGPSKAAP